MFSAGSAKYLKHDAGMKMKIHRGRTEVVSTIYTKNFFFLLKNQKSFITKLSVLPQMIETESQDRVGSLRKAVLIIMFVYCARVFINSLTNT